MDKIKCTLCEKTFRSDSGLAWHIENRHQAVQETPLLDIKAAVQDEEPDDRSKDH